MYDDDVPVLIAGGSLVGLSTSLLLASRGVPSLAVERHPGTAIHPRAAMFNQRAIEIYRSVGLEAEIVEASGLEFEQDGAIVSVETLAGRELEYYFRKVNEGYEALSPSPRLFITQIGLEPILRRRADELGARLEYSTELISLDQDEDGVTALVRSRDTGAERTVRARYVIAADGSKSPVRERLGIRLRGHPSFSNSITIYFRADIRPLVGERNLSVIYVFGPTLQGFFRFSLAGDAGFLVVNTTTNADGTRNRDVWADMSEDRCVEYVREALGAPDLAVEIETCRSGTHAPSGPTGSRTVGSFWPGTRPTTCRRRAGSGGTRGVADAHNLVWKLALVLHGSAGPRLLETYDAERRPVGEFTSEQAYTRYVLRLDPELGKEDILPFVPDPPIELGHRYRSSAVIPEGDDDGLIHDNPHEPSGRPGTRAPHVELEDGSTLDLFGRGFVVLCASDAWCRAAEAASLDAHRIEAPGFATAYGNGAEGAVLVRPDGFIAWRARRAPDDGDRELSSVLAQILAL